MMDRHTWQRIHDLSAEGLNIRAIARRLRIHRRTVRKALDAELQSPFPFRPETNMGRAHAVARCPVPALS